MNEQDDEFLTILAVPVLASIVGPSIAAKSFPQVGATLVSWNLLADEGVLIPVADGVGLGLPQVLFAVAALVVGGLLLWAGVRHRRASAEKRRQTKGARA